jgi:hypothetical protein
MKPFISLSNTKLRAMTSDGEKELWEIYPEFQMQ